MKLLDNKKGLNVNDLQRIGISMLVIALVLGLGGTVLNEVKFNDSSGCTENTTTHECVEGTDTWGSNVTGFGLDSLISLSSWLPTIALVVVIAVILGIVMMYVARRY